MYSYLSNYDSILTCYDSGTYAYSSELAGQGLSDKDNWDVVLGEHYQGFMDGTEQFVNIDKLIRHPDFVRESIQTSFVVVKSVLNYLS